MINNKLSLNFPGGFAVLMSVHFQADSLFFSRAVDSIFENTLKPNQVIIVIDGKPSFSLRNTIHNLNKKYFKKITWVYQRKNTGLAISLNRGLKYVRCKWVVRADADDLNLPYRFITLSEIIKKNPDLDLLGSSILEIDSNEKILTYKHNPESEKNIKRMIKFRSPFNHMSVAYKLESILSLGGYPKIYLKEDYGLWCLFIAHGMKITNIRKVLVHATAGDEMIKRRGGVKYIFSEYQIQSLIVKLGLNNIFSSFIIGLLRASVFSSPFAVRKFIYLNFLR